MVFSNIGAMVLPWGMALSGAPAKTRGDKQAIARQITTNNKVKKEDLLIENCRDSCIGAYFHLIEFLLVDSQTIGTQIVPVNLETR